MAENRQYDHEYKVQAVKLAKEIGQAKAAKELGVPKNTMYGWVRANRLGSLDLGAGSQTPQSAMTLNQELLQLRRLQLVPFGRLVIQGLPVLQIPPGRADTGDLLPGVEVFDALRSAREGPRPDRTLG